MISSPVPVPQPRVHFDVPEISQRFHVKGPIPDEMSRVDILTTGHNSTITII